jgi:predicted lysophospholipase L1 biosynthesis ABC-type transport system permease subunit
VATGFGGWARIVGVVEDVAESDLTTGPQPARYLPHDLLAFTPEAQVLVFRVREGQDPSTLLEPVRRAIQSAAPSVAIQDVTTMERVLDRAIGPVRQVMTLVGLLTGLALLLGAIGIYGVISHFVTRHRKDWGVRIALGLTPAGVVRGIVRRGVVLVVAGVGIGTIAFFALASLLSSLLYGVRATDPIALGVATVLLLVVGALAALLPALRASRTDAAIVLREP